MPNYTDQLKRIIDLPQVPKRIISLVPSQTELLFDLGLDEEVAGITKFCIHPNEWFRNKTRIGGTKTVNIELIRSLHPDLIIANKEENVEEQVLALEKIAPVWISDINTIDDAIGMIKSIGSITGKTDAANQLAAQVKNNFDAMPAADTLYRTAYLIWKDPYMAAGSGTFINDVMKQAGLQNVLEETRYPEIAITTLAAKNTELLLLSSEPYPFKQKHIDVLQEQLPQTKILLVDGEMFSWYGSRLRYTANYLTALLQQIRKHRGQKS